MAATAHWLDCLSWLFAACFHLMAGFLGLHARFVHHVQSWLMSRGEVASAAAGISELLGARSFERVLEDSRKSFRCVSAERLVFDDMADNRPNIALASLTESARLGQVDAFLSHSWHDEAEAKWAALQKWRANFKKAHAREPLLWIDKYCIDQSEIDTSLACLPVFLAGCKTLLVLCGETYLERLWCLIEIVVFLQMGGQRENLEVRLLREDTSSLKEPTMAANMRTSRVWDKVESFDPRMARCFNTVDTDRLHDVVDCTGYDRITDLVKDVFMSTP
jgi:hypothetical protein